MVINVRVCFLLGRDLPPPVQHDHVGALHFRDGQGEAESGAGERDMTRPLLVSRVIFIYCYLLAGGLLRCLGLDRYPARDAPALHLLPLPLHRDPGRDLEEHLQDQAVRLRQKTGGGGGAGGSCDRPPPVPAQRSDSSGGERRLQE